MVVARIGVVVTALAAILGVELVTVLMGRTATPTDVLGGLLVTLVGMGFALLVQGGVRALARRARPWPRTLLGAAAHTAVAAYALYVATGVDAPFGWLLGVLFGAILGAALPTLAFGPASEWAPAIVALRIAAFVGGAVLLASL
jgi:hypothetical protein